MSSDHAKQCTRCEHWLDEYYNFCPRCGLARCESIWSPTYHLSPAPNTTCNRCNNTMTMLATEQVSDAPAFYLCLCGYVGQLGKGAVSTFSESRSTEPRMDKTPAHTLMIHETTGLGTQGPGGVYKPDASPTEKSCARCGDAAMWIARAGEALCVRHQDDY